MVKRVWQGAAVLVVKQNNIDEFKHALAKIIKPTRLEKGCISYFGYQVLNDQEQETNRFEFHELWQSKEAMLIDHKEESAHMQAFFKEIKADTPESFLESFEVGGKYITLVEGA